MEIPYQAGSYKPETHALKNTHPDFHRQGVFVSGPHLFNASPDAIM